MTFKMVRIRFSVCCERCDSSPFEQSHDVIEFVQQLLEPQLVHLVDDDEQHLVMFGPGGTRLLQRQEFIDLEIAAVRRGSRIFSHM